jgi:hypothetical protein
MIDVKWKKDVTDKTLASAAKYVSIRYDTPSPAQAMIRRLHRAKITYRRANDILRAARREPLPLTDPGVQRELMKVIRKKKLSPVAMVVHGVDSDIADGYHRVSLAYWSNPFSMVPLRVG